MRCLTIPYKCPHSQLFISQLVFLTGNFQIQADYQETSGNTDTYTLIHALVLRIYNERAYRSIDIM